jgi:hypothetical protein
LVVVAFVVVEFVAVRFVIVATVAVNESTIALVNRARVEKKDDEVAFVIVALDEERFATVDEPNAMSPPENVRSVVVAFPENGSAPPPVASAPHESTPNWFAFTSQLVAFKFETISPDVEARPETERFVVVALVVVVFPNTFPPVKVLSLYVFGIVVDAFAKYSALVVENEFAR